MSYTPNTWKTGDVITAEKMNHVEEGIQDTNTLVVNANGVATVATPVRTDTTIDKTSQEIFDAIDQGKNVVILYSIAGGPDAYTVNVATIDYYVVSRDTGKVAGTATFSNTSTDYTDLVKTEIHIGENSIVSVVSIVTLSTS